MPPPGNGKDKSRETSPVGRKAGGKGTAMAFVADTSSPMGICPLGESCTDGACWKTKQRLTTAAYVVAADDSPYGDSYVPTAPHRAAGDEQ